MKKPGDPRLDELLGRLVRWNLDCWGNDSEELRSTTIKAGPYYDFVTHVFHIRHIDRRV